MNGYQIKKVFRDFGVPPEDISYVLEHLLGYSLGIPEMGNVKLAKDGEHEIIKITGMTKSGKLFMAKIYWDWVIVDYTNQIGYPDKNRLLLYMRSSTRYMPYIEVPLNQKKEPPYPYAVSIWVQE